MARVFLVDAMALRRVNDLFTFARMLATMQADQQRNTWMPERYNCEGLPTHDPFYHEYPEVIAMVIERVKYGISVGLGGVEVLPWTALFAPPAAGARTVRAQTTGKAHAGPLRASFRYMLSGTLIEYSCLNAGSSNGRPCSLQQQRRCIHSEAIRSA